MLIEMSPPSERFGSVPFPARSDASSDPAAADIVAALLLSPESGKVRVVGFNPIADVIPFYGVFRHLTGENTPAILALVIESVPGENQAWSHFHPSLP
jgi:hypothetical protein